MGAILISALLDAYNNTMKFADGVTSRFDEKKYAEAVVELYGREPTYKELDAAVDIIKEDTTITSKEKIELLRVVSKQRDELRDKEFERKKQCAETIDEGTKKKGDVAVKVAMGVMTGGVSLLPDAINAVRGSLKDKDKIEPNNLPTTNE